jgi:hypothetical protein
MKSYNSKMSHFLFHAFSLAAASIVSSGVQVSASGTRAAAAEAIEVTPASSSAPLPPPTSSLSSSSSKAAPSTAATPTPETTTRVGLSCYFPGWPDRYAPVIEFEGGVGSLAKAISIAYYIDGTYMSEDRYEPLEVAVMPPDAAWPIGQYRGGPITIIITGEAAAAADVVDGSSAEYHDYDGIYINDNNGEEEPVACYKFEADD